MNTRTDKHKKNVRNKNIFISIMSIGLVLGLSLLISNKLSLVIYKSSIKDKEISAVKTEAMVSNKENYDISKVKEDNLVLFQGGVFTDFENAEDFRDKIEDKTIATIVNDGKYERLILGVANKKQFSDMSDFLKENNIQFVKQVYKFPENVKYNTEIINIIELFSQYILDNQDSIADEKLFDVSKLKNEVSLINADYGEVGSYKEFNDLKDLILELDNKAEQKDLESVLDFIYFSFKKYKN